MGGESYENIAYVGKVAVFRPESKMHAESAKSVWTSLENHILLYSETCPFFSFLFLNCCNNLSKAHSIFTLFKKLFFPLPPYVLI